MSITQEFNANVAGVSLADSLEPHLPPVLWRHKWNEYRAQLELPFTRGHMQNLDSQKRGPKSALLGGKIFYRKNDLLEWIAKEGWNNGCN
ncbi:hypothetical protein DSM101010T_20890 [Desulfovibrio subterraneus]|uniref:Helix-turn-helix domain-containing protein n=1 Tax=Desulfovibrio subterraneus TaxID=2718620 RepID=A0A7J0BKY0_9BACT|nr:hypothetical protein DSM101010T_20890 [Desulfovibrio subterraneus]